MVRVIAAVASTALIFAALADGTFAQERGKQSRSAPKNELETFFTGLFSLPSSIIQVPTCDEKRRRCKRLCESDGNEASCDLCMRPCEVNR